MAPLARRSALHLAWGLGLFVGGCSGRPPEATQAELRAAQVWDKTKLAYAQRASYRDEGVVDVYEPGGAHERHHFASTFRGRGRFRFEFSATNEHGDPDRSTIVVEGGAVTIVEVDGVTKAQTVEEKGSIDEAAWTLGGSSHLTSRIVPLLLYAREVCQGDECSRLRYLGEEVIAGRPAYKLEMNARQDRYLWFWIDRSDHLIRRVEFSVAPSERGGGFTMVASYVIDRDPAELFDAVR